MFVVNDLLDLGLEICGLIGVELLPGHQLRDPEYACGIAFVCDSSQASQDMLYKLKMSILQFRVTCAVFKCNLFLKDWFEAAPTPTFSSSLEVQDKFVYLRVALV